ncbi:helix-turn-helix transcriptional regulator [Pseudonocardia sp. ICBG601]|uniref:helix-turn-helix transcriptional regulator n=1 Tax=Pseudonocardia sp. ICBG601 TaxID=2846759 RepID=UPI001CF658FA|nr:helix-turn-helix transcriptional regulator [Pseudonocardia sp. ICBG601]
MGLLAEVLAIRAGPRSTWACSTRRAPPTRPTPRRRDRPGGVGGHRPDRRHRDRGRARRLGRPPPAPRRGGGHRRSRAQRELVPAGRRPAGARRRRDRCRAPRARVRRAAARLRPERPRLPAGPAALDDQLPRRRRRAHRQARGGAVAAGRHGEGGRRLARARPDDRARTLASRPRRPRLGRGALPRRPRTAPGGRTRGTAPACSWSFGSWLRRQRAHRRVPRAAARRPRTFDAAGAHPGHDGPTASSGDRERGWRPTTNPRELLSAQESQIARLAAQGLSNREIGQRLFLSHRTVGSHLYRIFPKLGVTSRSQLSGALHVQSFDASSAAGPPTPGLDD